MSSNENQKKLSNEVLYLTNKINELSSIILKNKMKIGELEATNESLRMRLNDTSQINISNEIRQRVI